MVILMLRLTDWRDFYINGKNESFGHLGLVEGCGFEEPSLLFDGQWAKEMCTKWWDVRLYLFKRSDLDWETLETTETGENNKSDAVFCDVF